MRHPGVIEHRRARPFLAFSLLMFLAGCELLPVTRTPQQQLALDLQAAEARWAGQNLSAYSFTIEMSCFCPFTDPMRVTVRDGEVVSVTRNGADVPAGQQAGAPITIEAAFRRIHDSLGANAIEVQFHPVFGFPERAVVDPIKDAVDEEFAFDITDFEAAS